jgi:hypothetical protein
VVRSVLTWFVVGGLALASLPVAAAPPHGGATAPAEAMPAAPDRHHSVRGEVTSINEARGTLTLKTSDGDVDLRLPGDAIKGIKKGDRVTVSLVVKRAAANHGSKAVPSSGVSGVAGAKTP